VTSTHLIAALSGGVDSSVTALLLLGQGHRVAGLFMKNWEEDDATGACHAAQDVADARGVCERLGIPLHTVNFSIEYWDEVFERLLAEHRAGRTPNPDILCNRAIKFDACLRHALDLGGERLATGHYARIVEEDGLYHLCKGRDPGKDQSYFLYTLGQWALARALFPVGELHKPEVRRLAREAGLGTHAKKDSTGICFIGERNYRPFLQRFLSAASGEIRTLDERVLGQHHGVVYYTLGQRQGLGIGGVRGAREAPWYVVRKDLDGNILYVDQAHDHPLLLARGLTASDLCWTAGAPPPLPWVGTAKIRYRQADQPCTLLAVAAGRAEIRFAGPQWAVTPGQAVVLYQGERCLGGGTIEATAS
jgi:tRNA-specific 2-thiouridylase